MCSSSFSSTERLKKHMGVHVADSCAFTCARCSRSFHSFLNFVHHLEAHSKEELCCCSQCSESFTESASSKDYYTMLTKNGPKYFCLLCPGYFSQLKCLRIHLDFHQQSKAFSCFLCPKSFSRSSDFECHLKVHL
jgi:hypothetical protein